MLDLINRAYDDIIQSINELGGFAAQDQRHRAEPDFSKQTGTENQIATCFVHPGTVVFDYEERNDLPETMMKSIRIFVLFHPDLVHTDFQGAIQTLLQTLYVLDNDQEYLLEFQSFAPVSRSNPAQHNVFVLSLSVQ